MEREQVGEGREGPAQRVAVVPGCSAYWYRCDQEDDEGWGCGYRCCQMLVRQHHALRHDGEGAGQEPADVPTIAGIISTVNNEIASSASSLPPLKWGEWMSLEHIIHYFRSQWRKRRKGHPDEDLAWEYFIFESLDRRAALVSKLEDHLVRHQSLVIVEGTGMIFCIGGFDCRNSVVYVYILDPHGPPTVWTGEEEDGRDACTSSAFRFKGGVGWIPLDRLLFGTCLEEFFAAFPERRQEEANNASTSDGGQALYADVLDVCGGWRFLFIQPLPQ
ncbi:UFM1-specific peptidase 1 (non-functional) [Balamuthia mandrillaris]